jgi:hypothetical protein
LRVAEALRLNAEPALHCLAQEHAERVALLGGIYGQMADREALAAVQRLPLLEPDFQADAIELAPHRHRHALQALVHLVFEFEFADHLDLRRAAQLSGCNMQPRGSRSRASIVV